MGEPAFTCFLIGATQLLTACASLIAASGGRVVGVYSGEEGDLNLGSRYRPPADVYESLRLHSFDYLFSIANEHCLPQEVLGLARLDSINYHDGPLPRYAGLFAPSRAILAGEATHGVVWHRMETRLDSGPLLAQRTISMEPEETALSLNQKCFQAALASFSELLDALRSQRLNPAPQDLSQRTYAGRRQRLPRAGLLDWEKPAEALLRAFRSTCFGPYPNDWGRLRLLLPDGRWAIVSRLQERPSSSHPPGRVLAWNQTAVNLSTGGGSSISVELQDGCGQPIDLNGVAFVALQPLPAAPTPADPGGASEELWVGYLRKVHATGLSQSVLGAARRSLGPPREDLLARWTTWLAQRYGEASAPLCLWSSTPGPWEEWLPFAVPRSDLPLSELTQHLTRAHHDCLERGPLLDDVWGRYPVLEEARRWRTGARFGVAFLEDPQGFPPSACPGLVLILGRRQADLVYQPGLLDEHELDRLVGELTSFADAPPPRLTVLDAFLGQVALQPQTVALMSAAEQFTYRQLEERSRAWAHELLRRGLIRGDCVAICLPRGHSLVVAALAVLRCGAAYLPIDFATPADRVQRILEEAAPRLRLGLAEGSWLDPDLFPMDPAPDPLPQAAEPGGEDLAYILYTSGSTGCPKGTMVPHSALAYLVEENNSHHGIGAGDRVLQLCSPGFDASIEEIFSPLVAGATLFLRPENMLDSAARFLDLCQEYGLTIIGAFSSMLAGLLEEAERRGGFPSCIRVVTTGGEAVQSQDVLAWRRLFDSGRAPALFNNYGLTECTVISLRCNLTSCRWDGEVPLGRPLQGTLLKVDSEHPDQVGELWVGGPGLARGYLGSDESHRFVEDREGRRWFRTGDLVRQAVGGAFHFLGRADHQVKVLGNRVELGEIESCLRILPEILGVACDLRGGRPVAWVISRSPQLEEALQEHCRKHLPAYMVPGRIYPIDRFPLSSSGKVDRKALPEQFLEEQDPLILLERVLGRLPDLQGTFLENGGDSVSALNFCAEAELRLGRRISVTALCQKPLGQLMQDWAAPTKVNAVSGPSLAIPSWLWTERLAAAPADAPALIGNDCTMTYGVLARSVERLAARLGDRSGQPVILSMDRSYRSVVAMLAVWQAGGYFVPLDPRAPCRRRRAILEEVRASLALCDPGQDHPGLETIVVGDWVQEEAPARSLSCLPSPLAYVLYTSGSSGRPLGVVGSHEGLHNRLLWMPPGTDEVGCHKTALTFVDSLAELFGPLAMNRPVAVASTSVFRSSGTSLEFLVRNGVTRITLVPTFLAILLREIGRGGPCLPALRYCFSSGEPLSRGLAREFTRRLPHARLFNVYGSTEVSADVTAFEFTAEAGCSDRVPIGRPLPNCRVHLLDSSRNPVADGEEGEIYVSGSALARGYLGQSEVEGERFLRQSGERLFRMGDLGRRRQDGEIEFLGRRDRQLQEGGLRLEPAEIEHALTQVTGVEEAAVGLENTQVAYYTGVPLNAGTLRSTLELSLPAEFLPAWFQWLPSLPRTHSGKIDYRALPDPVLPEAAPPPDLLDRVCGVWAKILRVETISPEADFFELGGDSLTGAEVVSTLEREIGQKLPLSALYFARTPRRQACLLHLGTVDSLIHLSPQEGGDPVFFPFPLGGEVLCYAPVARLLAPQYRCIGLSPLGAPVHEMQSLRSYYASRIRRLQPEGPYRLAGLSLGGLVAVETARELRLQGCRVAPVVLIDSWGPDYPRVDLDRAARGKWMALLRRFAMAFKLVALAGWRLSYIQRTLSRKLRAPSQSESLGSGAARIFLDSLQRYDPPAYDAEAVLLRAELQPPGAQPDPLLGWGKVLPKLVVRQVPGSHGQMLVDEPLDAIVANELRQAWSRSSCPGQ